MRIVLIAAVSEDGTIGNEGKIPWHIREDLKRFKRTTMGHAIIMGRKTFEAIGRPLPGRTNIVLTRNPAFKALEGVLVSGDLESALNHCRQAGETTAFIIGGAEVYRQAIGKADTLLLTHVHKIVPGDTKFPNYDRSEWVETSNQRTEECSFVEYKRRTHG